MNYFSGFLLIIPLAILVINGCAEKSPIVYSPIKDHRPISAESGYAEQDQKELDEFFEENQKLYRGLARSTTTIDNAEDEAEDYEVEEQRPADAHQGNIADHSSMEWFELGRKAFFAGKWNEALNAFDKAIRLNPKNPGYFLHRGNVYDKLGDYKKAVINYNRTVKLDPLCTEAYLNRGFALNNLGEINKAIADIKKAAKLGDDLAQKFLKKKGIPW